MNIEHVIHNIHSLTKIPFMIHSNMRNIKYQNMIIPPALEEIIKGNQNLLIEHTKDNDIYRLTDYSELSYFSFSVKSNIIIVGPYLEKEVSLNTIRGLTSRLRLINEDYQLVDSFYNDLSILNNEEIEFIYNTIIQLERTDLISPAYKSIEAKEVKISRKNTLDTLFEELEYVKHNYRVEDEFTKIVELGEVEEAKTYKTSEIMKQLPKRALNNSLRNEKTRLTILNTLCTRAAIRGGIDVQLAHQISTNFGIMIEAMKSILDSDQLSRDIIVEYAGAVSKYSIKGYSTLIKNAILSIRQNINYTYTLHELAESLHVTKEHLSRQFKKETSMTVSSYIGYSKIIEAKKMLINQDYSISEVSNALGFSNSTYFSEVFKKHTGLSPLQYKKTN